MEEWSDISSNTSLYTFTTQSSEEPSYYPGQPTANMLSNVLKMKANLSQ